jgi:hypothetical protein
MFRDDQATTPSLKVTIWLPDDPTDALARADEVIEGQRIAAVSLRAAGQERGT